MSAVDKIKPGFLLNILIDKKMKTIKITEKEIREEYNNNKKYINPQKTKNEKPEHIMKQQSFNKVKMRIKRRLLKFRQKELIKNWELSLIKTEVARRKG